MIQLFARLLRFFRRTETNPDVPPIWYDLVASAPPGTRDISVSCENQDASRPCVLFKPPTSDLPVAMYLPRASLSLEGWAKWWKRALEALKDDENRHQALLRWMKFQADYVDSRCAILLSAYEALKEVGVETYGIGIEDAPGGHFLIGGVQLDGPSARAAMARGKPGDTNSHPFTGKKYAAGDREFFREWAAAAKETSE